MGYEADCTLTMDGRRYRGTARLEHQDLTFRGETRLSIPLNQILEVSARQDTLLVSFGGHHVALRIGTAAEKWAHRIAHPPTRLDKLGVKSGMRVAVIGVQDDLLNWEIESRGAVIAGNQVSDLDMIFFGAETRDDLLRLGALTPRLRPTGALWVIRAKGRGAAISESESMAAGKRAGLVDVKVVSLSATHSAEKYVIPVAKRAESARSSSARGRRRESVSSRART